MPVESGKRAMPATCHACERAVEQAAEGACPNCGGRVIWTLAGAHRSAGAAVADRGEAAGRSRGRIFLPGVHVKLREDERRALAASAGRPQAPRVRGGTSVYERRLRAGVAASRQRPSWAPRLIPLVAALATFALVLQVGH